MPLQCQVNSFLCSFGTTLSGFCFAFQFQTTIFYSGPFPVSTGYNTYLSKQGLTPINLWLSHIRKYIWYKSVTEPDA